MKLAFVKYMTVFFKILWKKLAVGEKVVIGLLILVLIADLAGLFSFLSNPNEADLIPLKGGVVVEGVLGQPRSINPLYAKSEADKVLSSLVFSGLVGYSKDRGLVPCLAEKWDISADKKEYKFYLKSGVKWQDGSVFDADDVVYTVAVLQNPDYNEALKYSWDGISVKKIDQGTVVFNLSKPYPLFLENLTVGIIPWRLWSDIPVKDFDKSNLNINAIGTGSYKIDKTNKDKNGQIVSIKMTANSTYPFGSPYIENLEVRFYDTKEALIKAYGAREFSSIGMYASESEEVSKKRRGFDNYNVNLPQYVALFFNTKRSPILADKAVRQALAYAIDKNKINEVVNYGAGVVIDSPILPNSIFSNKDVKKYSLDIKTANTTLSQAGWADQDGDGIKEKNGAKMIFEIALPDDVQFTKAVDELKKEWAKIGVGLTIKKADSATLEKDYIATRNFDILVLGESVGADPDPYSYWHSSQATAPGLNLAQLQNGEADKLIEEARQSTDTNIRIKDYKKFQDILAEELPAIFLYQPVYVYKIYDQVKGIDLSGISNTWERFYDVREWFVKYKSK